MVATSSNLTIWELFQMKNLALKRITRGVAALAAATSLGGLSSAGEHQPPLPIHYVGFINDFTTSTVSKGPYEMRGKWTLDLDSRRGTSEFKVEMDMETSDIGATVVAADPTSRGAHTHHIIMKGTTFSTDISGCPANIPATPAATQGFVVTGDAYITVNGGATPFANPNALTVCVTGGELVQFSNITLRFPSTALASGHFGTFPIHGVILRCAGPWEFESTDCTEIPD
jgi:hypothetical protein